MNKKIYNGKLKDELLNGEPYATLLRVRYRLKTEE